MKVNRKEFFMFAGPSLFVMVLLMVVPVILTAVLSVCRYTYGATPTFIGFNNYINVLFKNNRFWSANGFTLFTMIVCIPIKLVIGMTLALLLYKIKSRIGKTFFIAGALLPYIITPVVGTMMFSWLFRDTWGLITYYLSEVGINISWFSDPAAAKALVIIHQIWGGACFAFLTFYSGLLAMPSGPLNAVTVEGGNLWQKLRFVILPYSAPLTLFIVTLYIMDGYRLYDSVAVMTRGGPGTVTETVQLLAYQTAFKQNNIGQASAQATLSVIGIALLILPCLYLMYKEHKAGN